VLDLGLGCGAGTLCCDLAERGHGVTGVDPAGAMLAVARRKPHAEWIEWVESTAQNYKAHRCFDLIVMTGHAFQVLLNDADALAAPTNPAIPWATVSIIAQTVLALIC
jgi:ubiquinone/menaquinone biosynthesis C-methylase UbiE